MKVCFETFGCRLNKAEALQMEADYLSKGWVLTEKHAEADLFVVRGCSVTARAEYECEKLIDHLQRRYPRTPIRVCGCIKSKVHKSTPLKIQQPVAPETSVATPTRTARAYLKVQDGCSGQCTFCIVPKFRGKSKSESFTDVIDRAKRFIDSGYHELVITGCNLSLYASEGNRFPELISAIAELDDNCRVRIGSLEPGMCALETVEAMAEHKNICRFLHIPIQSGSNRILMSMKRPYLIRDVDQLINRAIMLMPQLGLGCDLMTGFPGESDLDFNSTVGLLKRHPFSNAHIFPYSERRDTQAAAYMDVVPKMLRSARAHLLSDIIKKARHEYARKFIGQEVEIVVEREGKCTGWTGEYLQCEAYGEAPRKSIAKIFVTGAQGSHLKGKLVG